MNNSEKYRQAFSPIHVSEEFSKELKHMEKTRQYPKLFRLSGLAACLAVFVLLMTSATVAYAADIGGFRQVVKMWIHGTQIEAQIDFDGQGNYDMEYVDGEGNVQHRGGGGVALGPNGEETPLSPEELMEQMDNPEVVYEEDGKVMVFWRDQAIDITDQFEDGYAYVLLEDGGEKLYLTAEYGGGYAASSLDFVPASDFGTTQ